MEPTHVTVVKDSSGDQFDGSTPTVVGTTEPAISIRTCEINVDFVDSRNASVLE